MLAFVRDKIGIKTIIDLRNKKEKDLDPYDCEVEREYPTVRNDFLSRSRSGAADGRQRFNIPLMTVLFKLKGLFWDSSDGNTKR